MAEATKPTDKDEELDELLDSALEDFNKPPPSLSAADNPKTDLPVSKDDEIPPWNNEFLLEAQKAFENNMKTIFGPSGDGGELSPDNFGDQLQKIAEEANKVLSEHSNDPEFSATIAQTLKNLSDNTEKMQTDMGQDALAAMLGGLGLGTEEDTAGDFMPFMQSMMQPFLSKEVLYPSIKEITEKYPVWLEEHKSSLSETDYTTYNKQYELMTKVCIEFEKETESDSEEKKKETFGKILAFMEEMQKLGQPPKDLCDENGLAPVDLSQCSIM